jgi:hypothetical protein
MANIIVSAHAGRFHDQTRSLIVPQGSSIVYYVPDGGLLPNDEGYEIFYALSAGRQPRTPAVETVMPGESTFDYSRPFRLLKGCSTGIYD